MNTDQASIPRMPKVRLLPHEEGFQGYDEANKPQREKAPEPVEEGASTRFSPHVAAAVALAAGIVLVAVIGLDGPRAPQVGRTVVAAVRVPVLRGPVEYGRNIPSLVTSDAGGAGASENVHFVVELEGLRFLMNQALPSNDSRSEFADVIEALASPAADIRAEARGALLDAGPEARPLVLGLLDAGRMHPQRAVEAQKDLIDVASLLEGEEAADALQEARRHPDGGIRLRAMLAVCGRNPGARVDLALESLSDPDTDVRLAAYGILSRAPMEEVEPSLLDALEGDEDLPTGTRVKMASLLARSDSSDAMARLVDLLGDEDEVLRHAVALSMGEVARRRDDLRPVAWDHLECLLEEDGSPKVQNAALVALADLDGEKALPAVRSRIGHGDPEVRKTARSLLRRIRKEALS